MTRKKTNYGSGADAERYIRSKLEKNGYKVVRAAGSKGSKRGGAGAPDLIAIDATTCLAIEVKRYHLSETKFKQVANALMEWVEGTLCLPIIVQKQSNDEYSRYEFIELTKKQVPMISMSMTYEEAFRRGKHVMEIMAQKMKMEGYKDSDIIARIQRITEQIEQGSQEDAANLLLHLEKEWL